MFIQIQIKFIFLIKRWNLIKITIPVSFSCYVVLGNIFIILWHNAIFAFNMEFRKDNSFSNNNLDLIWTFLIHIRGTKKKVQMRKCPGYDISMTLDNSSFRLFYDIPFTLEFNYSGCLHNLPEIIFCSVNIYLWCRIR